jgi:protein gp37
MAEHSKIQWTEATWSPTVGCTHVSAGCDHCYAATLASGRLKHLPEYEGLAEHGKFNGTVRLLEDRLTLPLKWRKPRMIFVDSMSDLFHEAVPDEYIAKVWAVMGLAHRHTFQILTKRHARMRSLLSRRSFVMQVWAEAYTLEMLRRLFPKASGGLRGWPLPNVWLGVSAENQHWTDIRIPALLDTPAAVRFVSAEPLLGPIRLFGDLECPGPGDVVQGWSNRTDYGTGIEHDATIDAGLDWVIVGGESGRGARPMQVEWARSLRDQCEAEGVPFFFKQAGAVLAREWGVPGSGHDPDVWPEPFPREMPQR